MRATRTILVCVSLAGLAHVPCCAAEPLKHSGAAIVAPDAPLELLYTRTAPIQGGLTEGPAVAPDGSVYFSDIPEGRDKGLIVRCDPRTKAITIFAEDSHKSNGLKFDAQGDLVACEGADFGGRCIARWNRKTGQRTIIADRYQGKRFNAPNDLCLDRQGRIYFSDPKYLGAEPRELEYRAVYRIDAGGQVVEVTHEIEKPNGLVLSPDERWLYVADHNNGTDQIDANAPQPQRGAMKIYAFPLGADGLVSGPRQTLLDFGSEPGCDGMTVDSAGNIYLTARSPRRPGVLIIDAHGHEIAFIATGPSQPGAKEPVGLPSNLAFGIGDDSSTLYITIDKSLYRIGLKSRGFPRFSAKPG